MPLTLRIISARTLFALLSDYATETRKQKQDRLKAAAEADVKGKERDPSKKPKLIKFGINHIATLVEKKKAKLVVIAHDVDPIELVLWLPVLCRRMDVPYCIVKGKARLGALVNKKTATAVALTEVKPQHVHQLEQFIANIRPSYNDASIASLEKWGGGVMGYKHNTLLKKRQRAAQRELTAKA